MRRLPEWLRNGRDEEVDVAASDIGSIIKKKTGCGSIEGYNAPLRIGYKGRGAKGVEDL
jgi:hypothetical protein